MKSSRKRMLLVVVSALLASLMMSSSHGASADRVKVVNLPGAVVPDAEVDSTGTVHVAYLSNNNVYYVSSADGGDSFSNPVRVNPEIGFATGGLFRGPDLTIGKDDRIHIGWYNNAYALKRPGELWFMYSRMNEENTGFEPARNLSGGPGDNFSLAANDSGYVGAIWVHDDIFISLSSDGGQAFAQPAKGSADPCECCGTRALYLESRDLYFLYRDKADDNRDMYLGRINPSRGSYQPVRLNTETWHLNACPLSGNYLTEGGGYLLAAWELKGGIYFSRLSKQGKILSPGEVKVSNKGKYPVVMGSDDGILVAWKYGTKLKWQLYDLGLNVQGHAHTIKTSTSGRPAGVVLKSGEFLIFP